MFIVGDIAGQFDAMLRLIEKLPKDEEFVFVGDLIDRGPKSKEVLEWVKVNAKCILGNHEHMMIDFYRKTKIYDKNDWYDNGGKRTIESYGCKLYGPKWQDKIRNVIPEEHILWLESLPLEIRTNDGLLITHAPYMNWDFATTLDRIWNRENPDYCEGYFNIFGHNSHWGLKKISDYKHGQYAMCIDASAQKVLTAVHWPSLTVFQEPYEKK